MLNVSEAYKTAIDNINGRHVTAKVNLYFDGPGGAPTTYTNEDHIVHIQLLEEARAETQSPLGSISSNELSLQLLNSGDMFNPENINGPFYGKLKPGVKVEFFILLEISEGVFEEIPMGIFKTSTWNTPSSTMVASVTCYDRLYELCQLDMPRLPALRNTTLKALCELLFMSLGLSANEYHVDSTLNVPLDYGWFKEGNVRQALQDIMVASCSNINVDRTGVIRVASVLRTTEVAAALEDLSQVIYTEVPQSYYQTYSKVKVLYTTPRLSTTKLLASLNSVKIPVEGLFLTDLEVSNGPAAIVDKIVLVGAKSSRVATFGFSAWGLDLAIMNTGEPEEVTVEVYGKTISTVKNTYTLVDDTPIIEQYRVLEVESIMVQSMDKAKELANTLLKLARDPVNTVVVMCRGNPALEVFDLVAINSPSTNLANTNIVPIRYTYIYDGGLSCEITGMKQTSMLLSDWVCVSPGLYIETSRYLFKEE